MTWTLLRTYGVGDAVGESYEFYFSLGRLPLGQQGVQQLNSRFIGFCVVVTQINVSESHG